MRRKLYFLLLSLFLLDVALNAKELQATSPTGSSESSIQIELTPEEKAWLDEHKNIRIGVDPDYPPFDFVGENGSHMGIASEYVRLLEKRLGISMKVMPDLTWDQAVEGAKNRTIDVIPMITSTPEREAFLSFSKPYISFPEVIITRRDYPAVGNLGDFAGNKVAVVKGYRSHKILIKEYPSIKSYVVGTSLEGLKAVSVGKADAFIGNLAVNSYLMQEHMKSTRRWIQRIWSKPTA